jgi:hypothetical protein
MEHNGKLRAVYLHFDGYIDGGAGETLAESYDRKKTLLLIAEGDLSILGDEIGTKHDFDTHDTKSDTCLFYGRDREEEDTGARDFVSRTEMILECDTPYYYLLDKKGVWWASRGKKWFDLKKALKR